MPLSPGRYRWPLLAALLALLLVALGPPLAEWRFGVALGQQLEARLPERLSYTPQQWDENDPGRRILTDHMNRDLATLAADTSPGSLARCGGRLLRLQGEQLATPEPGERLIPLSWRRGAARVTLELGLACRYNWAYIAATQVPLALLLTGLLASLPPPLSDRRRHYLRWLQDQGWGRRQALRLTRGVDAATAPAIAVLDHLLAPGAGEEGGEEGGLPPAEAFAWIDDEAVAGLAGDQLAWFERALELCPGEVRRALDIARAAPELVLYPGEARVSVHGVSMDLPATPFFYYCWYARRRQRDPDPGDGGWFTNPPANRADHEQAGELVALMLAHQGHGRAITDLREKGLRAKTLDQNRSKVKEQLSALLGPELAAPYLFEMERDPRTARFRCRLATPPGQIRILERPAAPESARRDR